MEHFPVLLDESLAFLAIRPDGNYVDCTAGLGGHCGAIARRLAAGKVLALDRDGESLELARANTADCAGKIEFRRARFSGLRATLLNAGCGLVDGMVADLGVSRMQLTTPERGLSLLYPGPLDMRLSREDSVTAADLVNELSERELARLFVELGEERRHPAEKIAKALVAARPVRTVAQFTAAVESVVRRTGRLHPATRVAQALRARVNSEPEELDALLEQAPECLKPGGRFVVIAFHSLDDRKVKHAFRELGRSGRADVLTKHVVRPRAEETRKNPASRSAVLRALAMRQARSEDIEGEPTR
jgi:16S rRNA (cytosine1402-N4)-methyltransferase